MAKDNLQKILDATQKFAEKVINKIVDFVHQIDPKDNTRQRVISALILIPLALYAIFYSFNAFLFLSIVVTILMVFEWLNLIKNVKPSDQIKWQVIGLFYIVIPIYSLIKIRLFDADILFWMFAIIWTTDIFAFFAGRTFGGKKLCPEISPNKTWSGLIAGVVASALLGFISSFMFSGGFFFFVFVSALIAVIEQASDLMESKFKRIFGVKDSGNIIPGHGGVLDRLDGMMLVAPFVLLLISIFPVKFGV